MKKIATWLVLLTLLVVAGSLLGACGPKPFPIAAPTTAPQPTARPQPTAAGPATLATYEHPGGFFTISYPENWQSQEQTEQVIFYSPDKVLRVLIQFTDAGKPLDEQGMSDVIDGFFSPGAFGSREGFARGDTTPQSDGSIMVDYTFTSSGNASRGVSFFEQHGSVVYVLSFWALDAQQWDAALATFDSMANSFQTKESPSGATADWETLASTVGRYTISYPPDWTAEEIDGNARVDKDDETFLLVFVTTTLPVADPSAAERALVQDKIDAIFRDDPLAKIVGPDTLLIGGQEGVYADFTYIDPGSKLENQGTAVAVVYQGRAYEFLAFTLSQDADQNIPLFTDMLLSFRFK